MQKSTAIPSTDQRASPVISLTQAPGSASPHTPRQIVADLLAQSPLRAPIRSLYIHVPFCVHKCHYCDFYSIVDTQDRQEAFARRLIQELEALAPLASGQPLETIFVGGGTPSLMRSALWKDVLQTLAARFDMSAMGRGIGEFTVECNPESVTTELMHVLAQGGVNRISMGAQSFHSAHLKTLERRHDPANIERALAIVRAAGITRHSLDLIFGVPGQTLDEWREDLSRVISLGTEHVSCYNLTYEPNTAMTARLARGEFEKADEDVEVEMYGLTLSTLRAAGMERYEVSNYATPGAECRHNLAYWRQQQWLAAGPSASAHVGGHRWKNVPRLDDYLNGNDEGFAPMTDWEGPETGTALREKIMTGIRLTEGLRARTILEEATAVAGIAAARALEAKAAHYASTGWIRPISERWQLTDAGFLFADTVASEMMRLVMGKRM
jgi:oxygen-independent coproporphyrinogen III oxidase